MEENKKYLTVEALTKYLKYRFDHDKNLNQVYLKGEVSNFKRNVRGHLYFTLKDENAQISCVMFGQNASKIPFNITDGMKLLVCGKVTIFEKTGGYQIYLEEIKEDGLGDLYVQFLQLKEKLEKEGYFKVEHKKPIPKFPKRIGVITSSTGAVIKDIINTTNRRYKNCEIVLYAASVQGENSSKELIQKIKLANTDNIVDVLIIGRGGGSLEDLWSFNDEELCKTIFNSKIPIISAVGHETDFTICDFVSDLRAPTPTAAAELATPNTLDLIDILKDLNNKLNLNINNIFDNKKTKLLHNDQLLDKLNPINKLQSYNDKILNLNQLLNNNFNKIFKEKQNKYLLLNEKLNSFDLSLRIKNEYEKINYLNNTLNNNINNILTHNINKFTVLNNKLASLNPLFILEKGFSVVENNEKIVKSINDVNENDEIKITVNDGNIYASVLKKEGNNGK